MHCNCFRVHKDDINSFSCTREKFGEELKEVIIKSTGLRDYVWSRNTRLNGRTGIVCFNLKMVADVSSGGATV